MSFTDQKPRKATEQLIRGWGGSREAGERFRCYLCGYKFKMGDYWRWVSGDKIHLPNFLVCEKCDDIHVVDKWVIMNRELKIRFWWAL